MKRTFLLLIGIAATFSLNAQLHNWSKSIDGLNNQNPEDVVTDASQNTYIAGRVYGLTDISGSAGISSGNDINASTSTPTGIIAKYDVSGATTWLTELTGISIRRIVERNQEIFFVGVYTGALSLATSQNGTVNFPAPPMGQDIIVGKLNATGTIHSVNVYGNFPGDPVALHITNNGANLLASFSLSGAMAGSIYGNGFPSSTFGINGFLVNMSTTSNFTSTWINFFTGSFYSECFVNGIGTAADPISGLETVFIGGTFAETVDLNAAAGTANISSVGWDGFLAKYDLASGNYLNNVIIGSNDWSNNNYIQTLKVNNETSTAKLFIGGQHNATCDFDPGAAVVNLTTIEYTEAFVGVYNLDLTYNTVSGIRGTNQQNIIDLEVTETTGDTQITVLGESDGYIAFDNQGPLATDTLFQANATLNIKKPFVLFLEKSSTGIQGKNGFFIEGGNNTLRKAIGSQKSSTNETVITSLVLTLNGTTACDMNGSQNVNSYTNSSSPTTNSDFLIGNYNNTLCTNNETQNVSTCASSYLFDGNNLTTSGTYSAIYTNLNGCDSLVTLNLTFLVGTSASQTIEGCGSVTSGTGIVYTTSGTFVEVIPNVAGCDSTITITATVHPFPSASATVEADNSITASAGDSYQWFNCTSNSVIANEISNTFSPIANGSYAVVVTSIDGCADTSSCVSVSTIGLKELHTNDVRISPNPTTGKLSVYSGKLQIETIRVYTINGVLLTSMDINALNATFELAQPVGTYLLEISTAEGRATKRVILN